MNSNDVLADFNDDEVTSSGKSKVNQWKHWEGGSRYMQKIKGKKLILSQTDLFIICTNIWIIDRNLLDF